MSRPKTGLSRPNPIPVGLNDEETEYLTRDSIFRNRSKADLLRAAYFRGEWKKRLEGLREKQGVLK